MINRLKSDSHSCINCKPFSIFRPGIWYSYFWVLLTSNIFVSAAMAQNGKEWKCFHGSDRTNKSDETGLLQEWPEKGPDLLWTASGLGDGYSSLSAGGNLLYTAGRFDNQTCVFAFDLNGKPVWKKPNGAAWSTTLPWATSYTGSRSTPTYENGILYHLSESGRLTAFNSKNGDIIWSRELALDFNAEMPEYGYSESVLIEGDNLYTRPAGKAGFQVCLNKRTGATIWANTEIPGTAGYNSLLVREIKGLRQIIGASSGCFYGVDAGTGKLLWIADFVNQRELNCTDAVAYGDKILLTSGYGKGSMLVELTEKDQKLIARSVWQSELMDNHHGGVILHNGYLYGSGSNAKGWFCLDFLTGKQKWRTDGKGSVTYADGMLYMLDEKGTMKMVKATPEKPEKTGEFKVPKGGEGMYWAHPVVCQGRLYIRHSDKIFAYDIRNK